MSVMTVQGPVAPEELGYTLSHEHLLCDLWKITRSYDGILDDADLAIKELLDYRDVGGRSLIDVTSGGLGRDPAALRRISERAGVHIIMGAGWYREDVYPTFVHELDTDTLASIVVSELTEGVDGTGIKAGVIGEIGTERYSITRLQERVFRACARAQRETGVLIVTHTTHFGELALEQIALLKEESVPVERIAISHIGDRLNPKLFLEIAREGVFLSIDNIGYQGGGYPADDVRAANVRRLIADGHLHQLLLSGDVCMKSHLRAYGGKGYGHVQREFLPILRRQGVSEEQIFQMTVANPARALDVATSAVGRDIFAEVIEESAE
jgi:predicted metal-dependent phosphotriesterase family hydrolase